MRSWGSQIWNGTGGKVPSAAPGRAGNYKDNFDKVTGGKSNGFYRLQLHLTRLSNYKNLESSEGKRRICCTYASLYPFPLASKGNCTTSKPDHETSLQTGRKLHSGSDNRVPTSPKIYFVKIRGGEPGGTRNLDV